MGIQDQKGWDYRARLVAKGYNQIAGVNFQHNFAPVTNEVTLRILLMTWVVRDLHAEVGAIQTAFLHGDLELFLKFPDGYKEYLSKIGEAENSRFLRLNKSIYGLVQAARAWWKKFTGFLVKQVGFTQFENDNCLLKKVTNQGIVYLILYVDDFLIIGNKGIVMDTMESIMNEFGTTKSDKNEDFIGCKIRRENNKTYLSKPNLIKRLSDKFGHKIQGMKEYETPAAGGAKVIRKEAVKSLISEEAQKDYRSGVGSLLYLLKHSRPDLCNAVRELSKVMDGANRAHEKMLFRAIKYVQSTKERELVLEPKMENLKWEMKAFCDSDFAGDVDERRSVSGFIIYVNGCPISWRSRGQKSVTLSSTEAEYVALSEVATEILYICSILRFLQVKQEFPIEVHVDNVGAIYLSKNASTSNRTKHIDTRYHFFASMSKQELSRSSLSALSIIMRTFSPKTQALKFLKGWLAQS